MQPHSSRSPANYDLEIDTLPPLEMEVDSSYRTVADLLTGRRIVKLGYFLQQYKSVVNHPKKCTMGRMDFVKEVRRGLLSELHFHCSNCEKSLTVATDDIPKMTKKDLNEAAVWGSLSVGIGHNQCEELFAALDVPFMTPLTFKKKTFKVKQVSVLCAISISGNFGFTTYCSKCTSIYSIGKNFYPKK